MRSARHGLAILTAAWTAVLLTIAALIRAHVLGQGDVGLAIADGLLAGPLALAAFHGTAGRTRVTGGPGSALLTARTLTGVRTVDLNALVSVRRFASMARNGTIDELRLRDRRGVRLSIAERDGLDGDIRRAIERASARPGPVPLRVTRHARSRLGLTPGSRIPDVLHLFFGMWVMLAAVVLPALAGYVLDCVLSGAGPWG